MDTHTIVWAWGVVAFILFPILGFGITKLDLEASEGIDTDEGSTGGIIAAAGVIAALWPFILILGLAAAIFVFPTWYLVTVTKTRHLKRKREAATEKEVLAKIEADKQAEDERIKREIEGADPMGFDPEPQPEPPFKRPQGRLRKSLNAQFYAEVALGEKRRVEKRYDPVPKDEIPSTIRQVKWM